MSPTSKILNQIAIIKNRQQRNYNFPIKISSPTPTIGFSNNYANWTFNTNHPERTPNTLTLTPTQLTLISEKNFDDPFTVTDTCCNTTNYSATLTFDWAYTVVETDFKFTINNSSLSYSIGNNTPILLTDSNISSTSQSGTTTILVPANQTFCFIQQVNILVFDNTTTTIISNFTSTPYFL